MVYEKILGYAKVKILKALGERELQLSDISRIAGVSVSSAHEALKDLATFRIVSFRLVGKTHLYRINSSSYYARSIKEFLKTEEKFYDILLRKFVRKTKRLGGIVSIILFGSLARGKEFPHDVDVLVICKNKEKIENQIRGIEGEFVQKYDVHISAIIMTLKSFSMLLKKRDKFALNVVAEGKTLFGKDPEEILNG